MRPGAIDMLADTGAPFPDDEQHDRWPFSGQVLTVEIKVSGGGEWELEYDYCGNVPQEINNVMYEAGGIDSPLFVMSELPQKAGRYKVQLQFYSDNHVDWETGINDPDYGFSVLSFEKLGLVARIKRFFGLEPRIPSVKPNDKP